MKRTWLIIAAWLLLLIPTLIGGGMVQRLLRHEQERIVNSATVAAAERARTAVDNIELAVAEVREGLLTSLLALPTDNLAERLQRWQRENPLIRNVFIWDPRQGLLLPDSRSVTASEAAFVRRYDDLFSNRAAWLPPALEQPATAQNAEPMNSAEALLSGRRELRKLASAPAAEAPATAARRGWLPWFSADQLGLLGWVEPVVGGRRYGVEVETVALLSRLIGALPDPAQSGETYALLDDHNRVVFQRGPAVIEPSTPRLAVVSAAPTLPHWQVAVYAGAASATAGRSFYLITSLVAATLVVAILFGGSLLLWQAWRHLQDARRKTSFVANVSHELKTPLTTIRMYAELLEEGTIRDEAKRRHYLRVIVAESQRLGRLVGNLLDFSRMEQGRKHYTPEHFDAVEFVDGLLDQQEQRLAEEGLTLTRQLPSTGLSVIADRDAVEQVLLNLLDNAVKYAASGGEVRVTVTAEGMTCLIRVADRGPGIPLAHRQRIFDKFHRIDNSLTSRQPGCGLGLSIARQLLLDQGGALRYEPAADGGAIFVIELPCSREEHR
jgi:signal transduction histidine kinase